MQKLSDSACLNYPKSLAPILKPESKWNPKYKLIFCWFTFSLLISAALLSNPYTLKICLRRLQNANNFKEFGKYQRMIF